MRSSVHLPSLDELLAASHADEAWKTDLRAFAGHRAAERVQTVGHPPRVKVLRVICHLLAQQPALAIERVRLRGASGCSDFRGEITIVAGVVERTWDFVWDCRWRATAAGYLDMLGYPDQSRAARDFGWQCFEVWTERANG